jgi:uncharacterized protein YxeA
MRNLSLFLIILLILFILQVLLYINSTHMAYNLQEGFTPYLRQTIRPHVRTAKNIHNTVTYHFKDKYNNFGRALGFNV